MHVGKSGREELGEGAGDEDGERGCDGCIVDSAGVEQALG